MVCWMMFGAFAQPLDILLPNGLQVAIEETTHIPEVTLRLRYHFDPAQVAPGVPHMVEHLLFEGSANVENGAYDTLISSANGHSNAQTGMNTIVLQSTVDKGALDLLLFLESDRMNGLCDGIRAEDVENQKAVIAQEMWNSSLLRLGTVPDRLRRSVFVQHPTLGTDIWGTIYDIEQIDKEMVCDFAARWLQPQYASLVLVGDVRPQEALSKVQYWFSDVQGGGVVRSASPTFISAPQQLYLMSATENMLYLAWPAPVVGTREEALVDTVLELLVHPSGGVLQQRFAHASGWSENTTSGGWVVLEVETTEPQVALDIVETMLTEPSEWMSEAGLSVQESRLQALMLQLLQKNQSRADILSNCLSFTTAQKCYSWELERRGGLTVAELSGIVDQYFSMEDVSVLFVGPKNHLGGERLP